MVDTSDILGSGPDPMEPKVAPKPKKNFFAFLNNTEKPQQYIDMDPYLPANLVGGAVPYIAGTEEEAVWNAASQACGTERVSYCYTIADGYCWYLASPSSDFANHPDSWCPLAAALPGNSEHWDKETVYLYEQEGSAGALRWDQETGRMQVYLGAARTILPKIQSIEANFVTINAAVADQVGWRNRALRQEQLSRALTRTLFAAGLGVVAITMLVWLTAQIFINIARPDLQEAEASTKKATLDLMLNASQAYRTDYRKHLNRIQELGETLSRFNGRLMKYEVKDDKSVEWQALVPAGLASDLSVLRAQSMGIENGLLRIKGTR